MEPRSVTIVLQVHIGEASLVPAVDNIRRRGDGGRAIADTAVVVTPQRLGAAPPA